MALHGTPSTPHPEPGPAGRPDPAPVSAPAAPRLTAALQTTLDPAELLAIFQRETAPWVHVDSIRFQGPDGAPALYTGDPARHRSNYRLKLADEDLGDLTFTRGRRFSEAELTILEQLLCALLFPLRNALRYRAAVEAARRDPLTGLENRAALDEGLEREVQLARRHDHPLSLVTLDIDRFKQVNDRYGHSAGDCVLREVVNQAQHALRTSDLFYRYGGEEFVALLTHTEPAGALVVAERIRSLVRAHPCTCDDLELWVTVSLGIAALEQEDTPLSLFDKADHAMYRAKDSGRDRVVVYPPEDKDLEEAE